ncbi:hypothetical protein E3N88_38353 [Mikania micrantha]|uniref:ARID domain-containing protein n=1 Tax=Mikania micrantha TaxID=192012 RepID=A0A5N6LTP9_9ASTR|nr:hypothetical protein E3N88_38353 [Mikania micrantha]
MFHSQTPMKSKALKSVLGNPLFYSGIRARKRKENRARSPNKGKNNQGNFHHSSRGFVAARNFVKKAVYTNRKRNRGSHFSVTAGDFKGYEVKLDVDVCYVHNMLEDEKPCEKDEIMHDNRAENISVNDYLACLDNEMSMEVEKMNIGSSVMEDCDEIPKVDELMSNDVVGKGVGDVNLDDSSFNPFVIDSLESCYLFFDMLEEPNYIFKYKRQLRRQILEAAGGYKNIDNEKWDEIGRYMGISTPYVVNLRPIFVGYLELFLFFYDRFRYEEKEAIDACVEKKNEAKKEGKDSTVMKEDVMKNDNIMVYLDAEKDNEPVAVNDAEFIAENEFNNANLVQVHSQEGSFGDDDEVFEDLDDFVLIEDKEPTNED